ncbi:helix-turn-helix domain-containing protein [Desulfurococcaceae archaeon AG1]|jgi:predicted DNA binding protein|nr:helix-turn-helix domain-containing protein [Desulfurococcaceae archaeon AG1]
MVSRAGVYYFEVEHHGCWTTITRDQDVVVKTLRQEFRDPEIFKASVMIIGKDTRSFITKIRRLKDILKVDINLFQERRWVNGERTRLALMDFESRRHGSISDLVYRLGGIILRQEVVGGLEKWKILIPRSSNRLEETLREALNRGCSLVEMRGRDLEPSIIDGSIDAMLTIYEKQALIAALKSGFIDYPRRAKAADVAKMLGVSPATFIYHFRRAEKKLARLVLLE